MGKTYKQQAIYNELHGVSNSRNWKYKVQRMFDRLNFWDWDLKILWRKHKDFKRGGESRIKSFKYK